ncbi:superoxide dismutase [Candidatus Pacearchaeota archaeon]|nr:superoxide dismutase [Candidatus Pacearchaeota archaeon]
MAFELPKLSYKYDALEPFIDAKTMEIHYTKHHQAYIDKLNAAVKGTKYEKQDLKEILMDVDSLPEKIRNSIINHGGGHINHSLFWELLNPNHKKSEKQPKGKLMDKIEDSFGSFDDFKKKFSEASLSRFGSGWAWLIVKDDELEVISTPNQDSPLMDSKIPILGLDVWEHAYYLKYQNKRAEYIEAFFNIINWDKVEELYEESE